MAYDHTHCPDFGSKTHCGRTATNWTGGIGGTDPMYGWLAGIG
jgi:hypothetical protein